MHIAQFKTIKTDLSKLLQDANSINMDFFRSGLYFLYKESELMYIGKSNCLALRTSRHFRESDIDFDKVLYIPIKGRLNDYEVAFIKIFQPKFNLKDCNQYGLNWALSKAHQLLTNLNNDNT